MNHLLPKLSLPLLALALWLAFTGCARTPALPCSKRLAPCPVWDTSCEAPSPQCTRADLGPTQAWVKIDSKPTPAAIYQDGTFIGFTPLRHAMGFTSEVARISLVAVPLYAGQAQQERVIRVPPLPKRVSFMMNNPPKGSGQLTDAEPR